MLWLIKVFRYLLKILLIAAVYFASAKFGLSLAVTTKQVTLVWPPTGIALSVLLLLGVKYYPGIFIGAFFANLTTLVTPFVAFGIATGNTLEALVGYFFLTKLGFNKTFSTVKDVLLFVFFAAMLSTMFSATIGVSSLIYGGIGSWSAFWPVWLNWWAGDLIGNMVIAPAILVWTQIRKFKFNFLTVFQGLLLLVILFFASLFFFTSVFSVEYHTQMQFKYFMFPFLLWASYSFKQVGSTLAVILVSSVAVWGAVMGTGPFVVEGDPEKSLLFLGTFVSAISVTFLFFSAIVQSKETAENKVDKSEKKFRALIENSADAIILINQTATILYASQSVQRVTGYAPEELVDTNGFNIIHKEDIPYSQKALGKLILSPGETIRIQNRLVRKDKSVRWMEVDGKNLLDDPDVGAIIINFRDITERMEMDQVKSEFVSLSAHQLRSPLSVIRWYTEALLSEKKFPENVRSYLSEIYASTLDMGETINLLLDVSKFELGKIKLTPSNINLSQVVKDIIKEKNREIAEKSINLTLTLPEKADITNDTNLTRMTIDNLVSNSIKYTPNEGTIKATLAKNKTGPLFTITDSGIGIPTKEKAKIFTKHFRGSNVDKASRGLGLGLYLTKLVVDLFGGKIWFTTKQGSGTSFFIQFPKRIRTEKELSSKTA